MTVTRHPHGGQTVRLSFPIPQCTQSQESLQDQLIELHLAATRLGLYDAADWLRRTALNEEEG